MVMSMEERRAYARGHSAGLRGRWPEHKPPPPPIPAIQQLMNAATNARNALDNMIATGACEEDEVGQFIDGIDDAMTGISKWLKDGSEV